MNNIKIKFILLLIFSEYGFQFIDDIDIGKEFKTEFYDIDQISDDSSKLSGELKVFIKKHYYFNT